MVATLLIFPVISFAVSAILTDDSFTNSKEPAKNYWQDKNLKIQDSSTREPVYKTYIKFDLSPLPAGTKSTDIEKAFLKIFVGHVKTGGTFNIYRVTSKDWFEDIITFSIAPTGALFSTLTVPLTTADENSYKTIDLTDLVKDWVGTPANNFGIALLPNGSGLSIELDSKENKETSHDPQLEILLVGGGSGYPAHTIGESYGGGIVFYVYDGGQHGLIAATSDQSAGIQWSDLVIARLFMRSLYVNLGVLRNLCS